MPYTLPDVDSSVAWEAGVGVFAFAETLMNALRIISAVSATAITLAGEMFPVC